LAENASFDILIDKIHLAIFAVGNNEKGRKRKVHKVTKRYIEAIL